MCENAQEQKARRTVEHWLLWCHEEEQKLADMREEVLDGVFPGSIIKTVCVPSTGVSNPTALHGEALGDLQEREQWLRCVKEVESSLPAKLRTFLRLKRDYRYVMKSWTKRVQQRFEAELGYAGTRQTYWNWWQSIVDYTMRVAMRQNLL